MAAGVSCPPRAFFFCFTPVEIISLISSSVRPSRDRREGERGGRGGGGYLSYLPTGSPLRCQINKLSISHRQ
jgi:hypothetical protein